MLRELLGASSYRYSFTLCLGFHLLTCCWRAEAQRILARDKSAEQHRFCHRHGADERLLHLEHLCLIYYFFSILSLSLGF